MKLAQYRLLSRILSGERLYTRRYHLKSSVQIGSLFKRGLIAVGHGNKSNHMKEFMFWIATDLGRRRHAEQKPEY